MTLFNTTPDTLDGKAPPAKHKYPPGFMKSYGNFNKKTSKYAALMEWQKQGLEPYTEHIAERALVYHMYCKMKDRMQKDFRTWLHNRGWEDDLFGDELKFKTPQEACQAFNEGKWTHCDGLDCTKLKVKWNSEFLTLGDQRIFRKDQVRECSFTLKFDGSVKA